MTDFDKAEPRTLYVRRDVLNAEEVIRWAKGQGFETTLPAEDMHVTIAFSRQPVDWMKIGEAFQSELTVSEGGPRLMERFGEATVLLFSSTELQWRHQDIREAGASWDHPEYQPHITISWQAGDVDLAAVEPYRGEIVLGPEIFEEINDNWRDTVTEKQATIVKTDDEQRMVYGWASVISDGGKAVVDSQGDVIEAAELVKATTEFMADARTAKAMHEGGQVGEVLHSFPLTDELAKSLGITAEREGWIVGVKVHDDEIWKSVKDGSLRAFSIGGAGVREPVEV